MSQDDLDENEFAMLIDVAMKIGAWNAFLHLEKIMEDSSFDNDLQMLSIEEMKSKYGDMSFSMMTSKWIAEVLGPDCKVNLAMTTTRVRRTARLQLGFPI